MPFFIHRDRKLYYREQGSGPCLLLLPGNTMTSASQKNELRYFGHSHRVVALDFSGTGQSDRQASWPLSWWGDGAKDALALLDHLGEPRARVMGASGGAIVALLLAAMAPERIEAVVADSCPHSFHPGTLEAIVAGRIKGMRNPFLQAFWRSAHGRDWRDVIQSDNEFLLQLAQGPFDPFGEHLVRIRCPVLLTFSQRDRDIPHIEAQVTQMARMIPQSRIYASPKGGHPLMWTCPGEFRSVAGDFLATLPH